MQLAAAGLVAGSSPRVRSGLLHHAGRRPHPGITSACAEQTSIIFPTPREPRDHLRVCGADEDDCLPNRNNRGSPPRVRSRHRQGRDEVHGGRITSACAEQTRTSSRTTTSSRDHLRVCGADALMESRPATMVGSPPRVRSRPLHAGGDAGHVGITSACAEQTPVGFPCCDAHGDHLRVCGADGVTLGKVNVSRGSPPRVRSRPRPDVGHAG